MKVRTWLLFGMLLGFLVAPVLPPALPGASAMTAWAQPAPVAPAGPDNAPPDGVVDGGGDGSPPPEEDLLPEEPAPADSTNTPAGWIIAMPTGTEWIIGLGVLLALWGMIWLLYRSLLSGWVRKRKHPANLRALLFMLAALVFILWSFFWFIYYLAVFGWWMALPLGVVALLIFSVALVVKK
jgi:hypothetical protein